MTRKVWHNKLFLFAIVLLFLGIGCSGNDGNTATSSATQPTKTVIRSQPKTIEPTEQAYDYCDDLGHQLIFRFNETTSQSDAYCQFADGSSCRATSFLQGTCDNENGSTSFFPTISEDVDNIRRCPNVEEPVCGADGQTYANRCIAVLQGVALLYDGVCTNSIDTTTTTAVPHQSATSIQAPTTEPTNPLSLTDSLSQATYPSWIENAKALAIREKNTVIIEQCGASINPTYYQYDLSADRQESCEGCFSVLYSKEGATICFPNNDFANACGTFDKKNRIGCKEIWRSK
jgi:putative hemolysin